MLIVIIRKVRQFFRALTAEITADDGKYISAHLDSAQQKLFFAMSTIDQYHCLQTAYTIEKFVIDDKKEVDKEFLIRCALLHDVGRVKGDMGLFGKVFAVLIVSFTPTLADKLERRGNKMIYVYRHHAEIGARKLQNLNLYREAKIIARHHAAPKNDDPKELRLLRLADEEN